MKNPKEEIKECIESDTLVNNKGVTTGSVSPFC
jgi:hypothetical protein